MRLLHVTCVVGGLILAGSAQAQERCVVTDPTGTPLNVRSEPNGRILGALHNGAAVRRMQTVQDEQGRPWTYVVPLDAGVEGWVYRRFVSC